MKLSQDKEGLKSFVWAWVKYLILPISVLWVCGYVLIKIDDAAREKQLETITQETQESARFQDSVERSVFHNKDTVIPIDPADSAELRLEGMINKMRR